MSQQLGMETGCTVDHFTYMFLLTCLNAKEGGGKKQLARIWSELISFQFMVRIDHRGGIRSKHPSLAAHYYSQN